MEDSDHHNCIFLSLGPPTYLFIILYNSTYYYTFSSYHYSTELLKLYILSTFLYLKERCKILDDIHDTQKFYIQYNIGEFQLTGIESSSWSVHCRKKFTNNVGSFFVKISFLMILFENMTYLFSLEAESRCIFSIIQYFYIF